MIPFPELIGSFTKKVRDKFRETHTFAVRKLLPTMPKVKTHSRAKKTFKVTGTGKIRRYKAFKSHLLTKKSKTRKRHLRQAAFVHPANENLVKRMLGMR